MGFVSYLKKSATKTLLKFTNINSNSFADLLFSIGSSARNTMETRTAQGQANAYSLCQPVNTVVNRLAEALINGVVEVKNEKGELPLNYDSKGYKKLFTNPNPFQNYYEFQLMAEVCRKVFGICYILPIRPAGFSDKYTNYYVLPNNLLSIEYNIDKAIYLNGDVSSIYKSIKFNFSSGVYNYIDPKSLIIVKDSTTNIFENTKQLSISRLVSLQDQVSNITAAYESRGVLIKNRGAAGAISPKNSTMGMPLPTDEKEAIEKKLQENYGVLKHQFRYIVSSAGLDFTPFEKIGRAHV